MEIDTSTPGPRPATRRPATAHPTTHNRHPNEDEQNDNFRPVPEGRRALDLLPNADGQRRVTSAEAQQHDEEPEETKETTRASESLTKKTARRRRARRPRTQMGKKSMSASG
mmetsp:Transcript_25757/g.102829  ORF Transcript_25757/g.102829 Transcript_25757/m.102829 type:complete len:112 (+) Transcript_25757:918-1253(+)